MTQSLTSLADMRMIDIDTVDYYSWHGQICVNFMAETNSDRALSVAPPLDTSVGGLV